jgi:type IV secretory pathway VirB10-like protein
VVLGARFLIEAAFIIAVAVVAGIEQLGTWWIIGLVAAAWLLVALFEMAWWALVRRPAQQSVRAERAQVRTSPPPMPPAAPQPSPPKLVVSPPPLPPPPAPPPKAEPEPEPEPEPVAYLPVGEEAREWNLWELERAARDNAGDDVARNEERAYLLMYLREFAGSDGTLPSDFDGLVRDAFGDLLHAVSR